MCPFDYTAVAGSGKVGPVNQVNHTSWVAVVAPTDRPKSVRNCFVIELFCGVDCVVTLPFGHICWCRGFCHRIESDLFLYLFSPRIDFCTFSSHSLSPVNDIVADAGSFYVNGTGSTLIILSSPITYREVLYHWVKLTYNITKTKSTYWAIVLWFPNNINFRPKPTFKNVDGWTRRNCTHCTSAEQLYTNEIQHIQVLRLINRITLHYLYFP